MNKLSLLSHRIAKFDLFIRKFIFDLKIIFIAEEENAKNYILFFEKFSKDSNYHDCVKNTSLQN